MPDDVVPKSRRTVSGVCFVTSVLGNMCALATGATRGCGSKLLGGSVGSVAPQRPGSGPDPVSHPPPHHSQPRGGLGSTTSAMAMESAASIFECPVDTIGSSPCTDSFGRATT
jgi:hypothetical protein